MHVMQKKVEQGIYLFSCNTRIRITEENIYELCTYSSHIVKINHQKVINGYKFSILKLSTFNQYMPFMSQIIRYNFKIVNLPY